MLLYVPHISSNFSFLVGLNLWCIVLVWLILCTGRRRPICWILNLYKCFKHKCNSFLAFSVLVLLRTFLYLYTIILYRYILVNNFQCGSFFLFVETFLRLYIVTKKNTGKKRQLGTTNNFYFAAAIQFFSSQQRKMYFYKYYSKTCRY